MATLNLGRIKPVFRGAYAGGTAYVVDDIVTSGGSSYICILASTGNAVSNATYWTQMAAGGTDVGTTITTQGDILYRDGSGLQRLAKPASNKFLQNTSGGVPSWEAVVGGVIQSKMVVTYDRSSLSTTTLTHISALDISFTPTSTSNVLHLHSVSNWASIATGVGGYFYDNTNSLKLGVPAVDGSRRSLGGRTAVNNGSSWTSAVVMDAYYQAPSTTAIDFRQYFATHNTSNPSYLNRSGTYNNNNDIDASPLQSFVQVTEYDGTVFTGSGGSNY